MTLLRWLVFLPALLFVTALVQVIGGMAGEAGPWWLWVPLYMMFGWTLSTMAIYITALICPKLKFGAWMFFGIFIVLEPIALLKGFTLRSAAENIIRVGNDFSILGGLLTASISQMSESGASGSDNSTP